MYISMWTLLTFSVCRLIYQGLDEIDIHAFCFYALYGVDFTMYNTCTGELYIFGTFTIIFSYIRDIYILLTMLL